MRERIPATGACFLCFLLTTPTLSLNATDLPHLALSNRDLHRPPPRRGADRAVLPPAGRAGARAGATYAAIRLTGRSAFAVNYRGHRADSRYYVGRRGSACLPPAGRGRGPARRTRPGHTAYGPRRHSPLTIEVIAPIVGTALDDVGRRAVRFLAARRPAGCTALPSVRQGISISAHNHTAHAWACAVAARCCRASTPPVKPLLPPLLGAPLSQPSPNHTQHRHGHR